MKPIYTKDPHDVSVEQIEAKRQELDLRVKPLAWAAGFTTPSGYYAARDSGRMSYRFKDRTLEALWCFEEHGRLPDRPDDVNTWLGGELVDTDSPHALTGDKRGYA